MPIPSTATVWDDTLDPYDVADYKIDCTSLLQTGETIASYSLGLTADAALLGLVIGTAAYAPTLVGNVITVWLSVSAAKQQDVAFDTGTQLPIELSITTSSNPPRKRQRTLVVKVAQK